MHLVRAKEAWIKVINPSKGSFCRLFVFLRSDEDEKNLFVINIVYGLEWINERDLKVFADRFIISN